MKIKAGWRYGAVRLGVGRVEGDLESPAPPDIWQEGGGEVVMPRWNLRLDDGQQVDVQEAELTVIEPRGIGTQPGPAACPTCAGTGGSPRPGAIAPSRCLSCDGKGVIYPE
jgi:hypothetical protein